MQKKKLLAITCIILLIACTEQPKKTIADTKKNYKWDEFCMGVDLSYVNQVEDYGGVFKDSGKVKDVFRIMKDHGANTVRIRLWHTPAWVGKLNKGKMYYDLAGTETTIRRAKQAGMAVNLDIHYSDTWADPHHQETPAAWAKLPIAILKDSVYAYTLKVLNYLKTKDLVPEMVQVGNETNFGMLWPVGKVEKNNYENFAALLNSGIKAVRDFSATSAIKPKIILHVAQLQDADAWSAGITAKGVTDFDILGLSHYVKWSTMPAMHDVEEKIKSLKATYGKQVMIVETAYPWTGDNADKYNNIIPPSDSLKGYAITKNGQAKYVQDLIQSIMHAGGTGIMYWEPAWITSSMNDGWGIGSSWENNAFFDFNGNTLPVIDAFNFTYK